MMRTNLNLPDRSLEDPKSTSQGKESSIIEIEIVNNRINLSSSTDFLRKQIMSLMLISRSKDQLLQTDNHSAEKLSIKRQKDQC